VLAKSALPALIYRVARRPAWSWPDWAFAGRDGTFGNRYDDPQALYRVLYASATRFGCFVETLAHFRPDLALYSELAAIGGPDDCVAEVAALGLDDLDAAALQMSAPRSLTQRVSREIYEAGFNGVHYLSKYGREIDNYALFEGRVALEGPAEHPIVRDEEDLQRALALHNLVLEIDTVRGEFLA
jgi:RES domain-containing protein